MVHSAGARKRRACVETDKTSICVAQASVQSLCRFGPGTHSEHESFEGHRQEGPRDQKVGIDFILQTQNMTPHPPTRIRSLRHAAFHRDLNIITSGRWNWMVLRLACRRGLFFAVGQMVDAASACHTQSRRNIHTHIYASVRVACASSKLLRNARTLSDSTIFWSYAYPRSSAC